MDLRQEYIKMRNSQRLNNTWLWSYYKSKGGLLQDQQEFINNFYFIQEPIMFGGELVGYKKTQRDLSSFFEDMDVVFGVTSLWSKDGNFIKILD
jgi:hypothetical protein